MAGQVTGIVKIKLNGSLIRSFDGAKLDIGGKEREAVTGWALYGYKEKFKESTVTCEIAHMADTDLVGQIGGFVGGQLEFDADSGISYLVTNAFCSKTPELTGGDGKVALEFKGDPAVQM